MRSISTLVAAVIAGLFTLSHNADADMRIISTDAGSTDIIRALGEADHLVGIDVTSSLPPQYHVAKLGYHRQLSAEGMLSLTPNIVIGSEHMGPPSTVEIIEKSQGITLLQLPTAHNPKQISDNIRAIAKLLGKSQQANVLLKQINQQSAAISGTHIVGQSVAFILQMDGRSLRMAGKHTVGDDIIHLLGGDNIADYTNYQSISPEALLALQPQIIIVANRNDTQSPAQTLLSEYPVLMHTPAGKNNTIVSIDSRLLVAGMSPRALAAVATLSQQLDQAASAVASQ